MRLDVGLGAIVTAGGRQFEITNAAISLAEVEGRDLETGRFERLLVADLCEPADQPIRSTAPDLGSIESEAIEEARRRLGVVKRFLGSHRRRDDLESATSELGVGKTTLYRWAATFREDGRLTSLLPHVPMGGRGKTRLDPAVERILMTAIDEHYLKAPQHSASSTIREVQRMCRSASIDPPSPNTVRKRLRAISERKTLQRRGHAKEAKERFDPRPDHHEDATYPLSVIQIDHTQLDIVLVDEQYHLPLSRPWLTLALDVFSRMVVGFYVSFDSPGALGTGLCLARSILPKDSWLARFGVVHEWPCWGFPTKIYADNAKEFRGEMLRIACDQYGIGTEFRPVAMPSSAGHIERIMGTVNTRRIHDLPGRTLKAEHRGDYDPEAAAVMTLMQFEQVFLEFLTGVYHVDYHTGIETTPLQRWKEGILGDAKRKGTGLPARATDEERLRLDFTPVVERTVQPYGVQIEGIRYYSHALRPYIGLAERDGRKLLFRRDPRDISVIHFWNPDLGQYETIPYRNVTHPAISIWELRAVQRHLEEIGRSHVDEDGIFETYEVMRRQVETADAKSKMVRRQNERRAARARDDVSPSRPPDSTSATQEGAELAPMEKPQQERRRFEFIQPLEIED